MLVLYSPHILPRFYTLMAVGWDSITRTVELVNPDHEYQKIAVSGRILVKNNQYVMSAWM